MNKFYKSLTVEQLQREHEKVKSAYHYADIPEIKREWGRILEWIERELEELGLL